MQEEKSPENPSGNSGIVTVLIVAVVTIVLAGVLLLGAMTRNDTAPVEMVPTTNVESPSTTADPVEVPEISAPAQEDPAVKAWHDKAAPRIAKAIAALGAPPSTTLEVLRLRCSQIEGAMADLLELGPPPVAELEEKYNNWAAVTKDAVSFCLEGSKKLEDEADALRTAGSNIGSTGVYWQEFFNTLAGYIDLTGTPKDAAPVP